jgi:hypothetical protein
MAFLTIFTAPKPFTNPHTNIIQRNAVMSWTRLEDVDVFLIGDEAGIRETAQEFGVGNVPQVKRDKQGVPLVSSVMDIGHANSNSPCLCYVNADIILMSDLVEAAHTVAALKRDFLLIGQRWNLELTKPYDFSGEWESRLRAEVTQNGVLYSPWGIDYFVFPRHLYTQVPDFTIGRPAWDNWMVYHARTTFRVAVDASLDVLSVHQNHDYGHLRGRPPYLMEVARTNLLKAGGRKCTFNTLDTNYELRHGRLRRPQVRLVRILRRLERVFINNKGKGWSWEVSLRLQRMQRPLAVKPRR